MHGTMETACFDTYSTSQKKPQKTNQQNKNPKKKKGIIISTGNKMTAGNQIL